MEPESQMTDQSNDQAVAPSPPIAPHPFNLDHADLILRSSDNIEFHVHKAVLAIASSVFATMLQLPQPASERSVGDTSTSTDLVRPTVDVSEDSQVLDAILRLCYPIPKTESKDLDSAFAILRAAMKYEMEWPTSYLIKELEKATFATPLQIWASACRFDIEELARTAAYSLVRPRPKKPLSLSQLIRAEGAEVLDGVAVGDYLRLEDFLSRNGEVDADFRFLSSVPRIETRPRSDSTNPEPPALFSSDIPYLDVLCFSSDGVDFTAHRAILSLHSDILKTVFLSETNTTRCGDGSSPDPEPGNKPEAAQTPFQSLSLLSFDVDSQTLSLVLSICYGHEIPDSKLDFPLLARALSVVGRYNMTKARVAVDKLWDDLAQTQPLPAYFAAIQHGMTSYARTVAKVVSSKGPLAGQYSSAMDGMSALAYYRLLMYIESTEEAVRRELTTAQNSWYQSSAYDGHDYTYETGKGKTGVIGHLSNQDWFVSYLEQMGREIVTYGPGRDWEPVLGALSLSRRAAGTRGYCSRSRAISSALLRIGDDLPKKIATAINNVELVL